MSAWWKDDVKALAARGGQMTLPEYTQVAEVIERNAPCRLLVFGCGRDSRLWFKINAGGETLFVEDQRKWATACPAPTLLVKYFTKRDEWQERLRTGQTKKLFSPLPDDDDWQVVLVDGPMGYRSNTPGRLGPIVYASRLHNCTVMVHDCHRDEAKICDRILDRSFSTTHHLRTYPPSSSPVSSVSGTSHTA